MSSLYLYNYNYHLRYLALVLDRASLYPNTINKKFKYMEDSSTYSLSYEPISFVIDKQLQIIIIVRTPLYLIIKIDPTIVPSLNSFLWITPSSRNFKKLVARSTIHQPYQGYKLTSIKYNVKTFLWVSLWNLVGFVGFINNNYKFSCY